MMKPPRLKESPLQSKTSIVFPLDMTNNVPVSVSASAPEVPPPAPVSAIVSMPTPVLVVPDPIRMLTCNRYSSNKLKSRLDTDWSVKEDHLEDLSPRLVLTKGPPDKLDASPRKLRFLATFGLTTLTARNELELSKLSRCRSLPSMILEDESRSDETSTPTQSTLSLPQPRGSPRSVAHCQSKLSFMSTLKLNPLSAIERKEREAMWQEVLAERRRRDCVTPLVQYCCQQRVESPTTDNSPLRWPGIAGILQAYQVYRTECSAEESVLRTECDRLQAELTKRRAEASRMEQQLAELNSQRDQMELSAHDTQQSINTLMSVVRAVMALSSIND